MKQPRILTACLLSLTLLLGACGTSTGGTAASAAGAATAANASTAAESAKGGASEGTTAATQAASGEIADLTVVFPSFGNVPTDLPLVQDEINKIATAKIGAKVTLSPIGFGTWQQQINLMLAGNEKIDLMFTFGTNFATFVANQQLTPMDDLLAQYGTGITDFLGEDYLKAGRVSGVSYGVATFRDLAQAMGLTMRKDICDKYAIDPTKVKSLDDVEAVLKTVKENEPDLIPLVPVTGSASILDSYLTYDRLADTLGVLLNRGEELKVVNWYESDEYASLVKRMRGWYQAGYILKDAASSKQGEQELMKAGRAFAYMSRIKPGFDNQASRTDGTPMLSATLIDAATSTSVVQSVQWTIPRNTTAPEKAMQFLNLMFTDKDVENLLCWGIEGKHYAVQADGRIDYPSGVDAATTGYGLNMGWAMGNQSLTYVWNGDDADLWKQLDAFNRGAVKSKALGFVYDSTPVKTEVAAVQNVVNQYKLGLEDGTLDPEKYLPEFISKLKDAGIDKIIAEKQKQLDAWAKANP